MDHRQRLKSLLIERSLELGDFTLASGERSSYYIDARRTTFSGEGQMLLGHVGLRALEEEGWAGDAVGGLTLGADPIACAIAHRSRIEGSDLDAFTVRKQVKEHGHGRRVEGPIGPQSRVVVVEDTLTTGGSALAAVHALRELGCHVLGVLALVDRLGGGGEALADEGLSLLPLFTAPELLAGDPEA